MREEVTSDTLDIIPSAEEIRRRIGERLQETRLLRSLLRVAEQRERQKQQDEKLEVSHA